MLIGLLIALTWYHYIKILNGILKMKKLALAVAVSSLLLNGCVIAVGAHEYSHKDLNESKQQLKLDDAKSLKGLDVHAGRGSLKIVGDNTVSSITVDAVIGSENGKDYEFFLERSGSTAQLIAKTDGRMFDNSHAYLDLVVRVPSHLNLDVNDGSGDMNITNIAGDLSVNDGSGSMHISKIGGELDVNDGSGDIEVKNIAKDVSINDGSGSIDLTKAGGSLTINDGSGDIEAFHVSGNVKISDGSGSVHVDDVTGDVRVDDGSGDIDVNRISGHVSISDGSGSINVADAGSLTIKEAGSGGVNTSNIRGKISM